jgi:hypothetical protein
VYNGSMRKEIGTKRINMTFSASELKVIDMLAEELELSRSACVGFIMEAAAKTLLPEYKLKHLKLQWEEVTGAIEKWKLAVK